MESRAALCTIGSLSYHTYVLGKVWEEDTSFNVINESCLEIYPLSYIETKRLKYQVKNKITSILYKLIKEVVTQL